MKQLKVYKYRFYPTNEQSELLSQTFGCVRVVWNNILDWRTKEYSLNGNKVNYVKASARLTELKKNPDFKWLNDVSSVALQQTLRNQDVAFSNFFNKRAKFPNFKKKTNIQSFRLVGDASIHIRNGKYYMPKDKIPLDIRYSRELPSKPSSVTISKDSADRYFISFCCEVEIESMPIVDKSVGIDLGLTDFVITSDGLKVKPLKALLVYQNKLAKLQKRKSKLRECNKKNKIVNSKRENKARIGIAKLHNKISDTRRDFLHKLSTKLINENQVICLEDLNVAGMIKNRKLAKHIADASWGEFVRQLEYKASWHGRTISRINAWYPSSQICSNCGHNDGKKTLDIRLWTCTSCNTTHDRDLNASINIHTAGMAEL